MAGKHSLHSSSHLRVCKKCDHKWCGACTTFGTCPMCKAGNVENLQSHIATKARLSRSSFSGSSTGVAQTTGDRALLLIGVVGAVLASIWSLVVTGLAFVGCLTPAILFTIFMYQVNHRVLKISFAELWPKEKTKKTTHIRWIYFWSTIAQLTLYIAGAVLFYKIVYIEGHFKSSGIINHLMDSQKWIPMIRIFYILTLPCLALYLMKVDSLTCKIQANNFKVMVPTRRERIIMNAGAIASGFCFIPFIFFKFISIEKKPSWMASTVFFCIPLTSLVLSNRLEFFGNEFTSIIISSQLILSLILIFYSNLIYSDYLTLKHSIKNNPPVEEMNESFTDKQQTEETSSYLGNWDSKDPFVVLGIPATATSVEIKKSYYNLLAQYHPDKVASLGPEFRAIADEKSKILNWAYEECLKARAA